MRCATLSTREKSYRIMGVTVEKVLIGGFREVPFYQGEMKPGRVPYVDRVHEAASGPEYWMCHRNRRVGYAFYRQHRSLLSPGLRPEW